MSQPWEREEKLFQEFEKQIPDSNSDRRRAYRQGWSDGQTELLKIADSLREAGEQNECNKAPTQRNDYGEQTANDPSTCPTFKPKLFP